MCPRCGCYNVRIVEYDFGTCPHTGYRDAGVAFECGGCGATGNADDLEYVPCL